MPFADFGDNDLDELEVQENQEFDKDNDSLNLGPDTDKGKRSRRRSKSLDLDSAIKYLEKSLGKYIIMDLEKEFGDHPAISTSSPVIDFITGIGGFPIGRSTELYGEESTGKSTLSLLAVASCQKNGGRALYLDYENALDLQYAKALGVELSKDKFLVSQPENMEQGFEIIRVMCENDLVDIIVIDSVAAMPTAREIGAEDKGGESVNSTPGEHARGLSQALRRLTKKINASNVAVIWINQTRTKFNFNRFGGTATETTSGGKALKFYASMRIELKRRELIKAKEFNPVTGMEEDVVIGQKIRVTIVKNKLSPPFKSADIIIKYGIGIDNDENLIDYAINSNIIVKKSAGYMDLPDGSSIRGREALLERIKSDEAFRHLLMEKLGWKKGEKCNATQENASSVPSQYAGLKEESTEQSSAGHVLLNMVPESRILENVPI